jgi:hypothetical protein
LYRAVAVKAVFSPQPLFWYKADTGSDPAELETVKAALVLSRLGCKSLF